jgi:hypothetical protein
MYVLMISLVVAVLAVARITRLLVDDRITIAWRRWVINKWGEESLPSYLVHCPWCMSIWVAIPTMPCAVLFPNVWVIAALAIPAASMVAGLLNSGE